MKSFKLANVRTEGPQEARIVRIVDLGTQKPPASFKNNKPKRVFTVTFELCDDKILFNGEEKPAVISMDINYATGQKAKLVKLFKAVGADLSNEVPFESLLGKPVTVIIENVVSKNSGAMYSKVVDFHGVTPKLAATIPEAECDCFFFDFDNPSPDILAKLATFQKDKMREALEYEGSELKKILDLELKNNEGEDT